MPEFTKGEIYGGMMKGFAQAFGDALTDMPTGKASEVAFGTTQTYADLGRSSVRVPSRSDIRFSGRKHPDRRQGLLYELDSGKGTRKPFAGFFSGCH